MFDAQNLPPAPKKPAEEQGGEFTRFFKPGSVPATPEPARFPPPQPATPSSPMQPAGDFAESFWRQFRTPRDRLSREAPTGVFSAAPPPPSGMSSPPSGVGGPPPVQLPPGESEYTRMIKRPQGIGSEGAGAPGTPAGGGAPAAPGMGMPQMQMPGGMPMVQGPQMQAPQFNASGPSFQGGHLQGPQAHVAPPQMQAPKLQAAPMPAIPAMAAPPVPKGGLSTQTILIGIIVLLAFLFGGLIVFLLVRK